MTDINALAERYFQDVHAVDGAAVPGEPEAQLTTPVSNLFSALVEHAGVGRLRLIRESRLDGSRPDFAALHVRAGKTHQIGYIELKAPDVVADPSKWTGRNASQWQKMSAEAEILLLCNGRTARLFQDGEPAGDSAVLPFDDPKTWDAQPLLKLLYDSLNGWCPLVRRAEDCLWDARYNLRETQASEGWQGRRLTPRADGCAPARRRARAAPIPVQNAFAD